MYRKWVPPTFLFGETFFRKALDCNGPFYRGEGVVASFRRICRREGGRHEK